MTDTNKAPSESNRSPKYQNPLILGLALLFAGISVALVQYKVPTILTSLMGEFSMDTSTASWMMSIFTLMSIFVAIPSGSLAKKFGPKNVILGSLILAIIGSIAGAFATSGAALIITRAIEGMALTALTTCAPIVVQQSIQPDKIGTTMGIWGIWGCLGSTVAALCTPTVYSKFGFVFLWLSYACVCALAFVVVLIVVKKPSTQSSTEADAASKNAPQPIKYSAMVNKNILLFFIAFAIFNICLLAVLSFVPTILQMQGFDSTLSGFLSTLPMLLSIVSAPLFGSISDKINKVKPLLVLAVFVMGPCTFLMYTFTNAILWIAAVIMGLIGMGCVGIFLAGYMKILPSPEYASVGMGVMICVQGIGQFLGTFLVQFLLGPDLTSWTFAGIVLMILGLIGTACLALCKIDK